MLVLHAGYPAALEALAALERHWPGRPRRRDEGGVSDWRRSVVDPYLVAVGVISVVVRVERETDRFVG